MNYLGHLYFSNQDVQLMLHNLYGDFIKGKDVSSYSEAVQKGIKLHRTIDYFIDNHPEIVKLNQLLHEDLPKVYPVAIDLFFDYYLAKNWDIHHPIKLPVFLDHFYESIQLDSTYKEDFIIFTERLKKYNWISFYHSLFGLYKMCNGLSRRLSFPNQLKNGMQVYLKHEKNIELHFGLFLEEAKVYFGEYFLREHH